jgi:hypothetical protein
MKHPKRKMEKTTTKIGRLLFLRCFMEIAPEKRDDVFRRGSCMMRR